MSIQQEVEVILARQLADYLALPIFLVDPDGNLGPPFFAAVRPPFFAALRPPFFAALRPPFLAPFFAALRPPFFAALRPRFAPFLAAFLAGAIVLLSS